MLYAWLSRSDDNGLDDSVRTLKEMHTNWVVWPVFNSQSADYVLAKKKDRFHHDQSTSVFPYYQLQVMRWSHNPYRLDQDGDGHSEEMMTPFLLPYWLGRYLGLITPPD
jgi:predicted aspartyl protease